jgi:hypothetical protein
MLQLILERRKSFGDLLAFILLGLIGFGGSSTVDIVDCSSLLADKYVFVRSVRSHND